MPTTKWKACDFRPSKIPTLRKKFCLPVLHFSFFLSECTFCKTSACYITEHGDVMGMGKAAM